MKLAKTKFQYVFSQTVFEKLAEDPHELKLKQELLSMRSRTIEMVRNKSNLRKVLGANLKYFGIKQTKFGQGNLHLLKSVAFEGYITGVATMSSLCGI